MQGATSFVEIVFEPVDLLAQLVAVASIPVTIAIRPLMLPSQPIILALQALKLGDRFLARGCLPARVHVPVNGTFENLYKYKRLDRRCRRRSAIAVTR
jgi:hypothetical protein